jgi:tRNA-specific 2-thiouridylase
VLCNREIKFRAFLDHALDLGADWIATGHYAGSPGSRRHELAGADANKDQTYFLHLLDQQQLGHACFPLADLTKPEVRAIARRLGLANAEKKDSTGICFIGERRFTDFLAALAAQRARPHRDARGEGGRRAPRAGLAHHRPALRARHRRRARAGEAPWFVAAKDLARNVLIVVQGSDHPLLFADGCAASSCTGSRATAGAGAVRLPVSAAPSPAAASLHPGRVR